MTRILVPLPDTDLDPTEVAVPWRLLRDQGTSWFSLPSRNASARCSGATTRGRRGDGMHRRATS